MIPPLLFLWMNPVYAVGDGVLDVPWYVNRGGTSGGRPLQHLPISPVACCLLPNPSSPAACCLSHSVNGKPQVPF